MAALTNCIFVFYAEILLYLTLIINFLGHTTAKTGFSKSYHQDFKIDQSNSLTSNRRKGGQAFTGRMDHIGSGISLHSFDSLLKNDVNSQIK
jgi:hypothetical protein